MPKQPDFSENANWKQRFYTPSIAWLQIASQHPTHGLICSNHEEAYQLYAWSLDSGELTRMTNHPDGVTQGAISADGETVYYLHDEQGNAIGHYFTIPFEGGEAKDFTPSMAAYTSYHIAESASGRFCGFMGLNQEGFQVFVVDAQSAGTPHMRYESESLSIGPVLSYDGEINLIATTEKARKGIIAFSLEAYDTITGQLMGSLSDGPESSIEPFAFSPQAGDFRLLGLSNVSGQKRPLIWNPHTGERRDLMLASLKGDLDVWGWWPDAKRILIRQSYQAAHRLYSYELETGTLNRLNHPDGVITDAVITAEGHIAALWQDAAHSTQIIELDGNTGEQRRVLLTVGNQSTGQQWQSHTFTSGSKDIQCWLATPENDGPYPVIVHLHGGPTDVQMKSYNPVAQAWLDHGFAFMSINYPGSTTFDSDFTESIYGQVGELETAAIADGVRWLISEGIAQSDAIFLTGASYGGYLVLMALAKHPDLFTGGIAIDPITDWTLHYQSIHETLRAYTETLFSGAPDDLADAYNNASPITHVDSISTPLLLIHAESDPRSPINAIQPFINALKAQDKPLTVQRYRDTSPAGRIQQQEWMLNFVYQYL